MLSPKLVFFLSQASLFCFIEILNSLKICNQLPLTALGEKPKAFVEQLEVSELGFLPGHNYLKGNQIPHSHGSAHLFSEIP